MTHTVNYCYHLHETFTTLPYFVEIGVVHHRTPQEGVEIPHKVIRCGEKVAEQLSANYFG